MEDGIERCRHSLNSRNDMYYEQFDKEPCEQKINNKTLYFCSPNDKCELDKCIITDNKQKMQELMKKNYKVSIFIADINELYNYVSQ
jgi:hypothetical protein